ncbi:MAG: FAD-dependent oxidoreductase [Opitutaceae bacterium]
MRSDILIVGQGLAGTLLGWECERAGISFHIADCGHATAASRAAAGMINPVTGRRLVKGWRVETLLPNARAAYGAIEQALGVPLWREMRVRRSFANARERAIFADKFSRGELAPYVTAGDEHGCWIEGAAHVDIGRLLVASRARWRAAGRLTEALVERDAALAAHDLVIDCTGRAAAQADEFDFASWEFSKGELLALAVEGLDPGVILNRRQWVLPKSAGVAWVGATHEPGITDPQPTPAARDSLAEAAAEILGPGRPFAITGQRSGIRVVLPDKCPVAGRHPNNPRLGLINALGAKGVLWAPWLARQWLNHLKEGVPFDPAIDVRRLVP